MTTSQYVAWAESVGASAAHPTEWTPAQRQSYQDFKLRLAREHFRWLASFAPRSYIDRAALIDEVRQDVRTALAPPAARPWKECGCHPRRYRNEAPEPKVTRGQAVEYLRTFERKAAGA